MSFPFRLYLSRFLRSTWSTCSTRSLSEFAFHVKGVPNGRMVPIGRRWPCAEGFYWPGTLLLTVILWVFTFSFKSIYNCEDKRSIWRDLEYRKTYHKSVRTHIVCDAQTSRMSNTVGTLSLQMCVRSWFMFSIMRKLIHDFDAFSIWVMHSLGS